MGEKAEVQITENFINNNFIGVAVKDGSKATFKGNVFSENESDVTAYIKKKMYSKPEIDLVNQKGDLYWLENKTRVITYMNTTVRREEYKYYIGQSELGNVELALKSLMALDPSCDNPKGYYVVKSLYFDTPNSRDLDEKMDGIIDREKYKNTNLPKCKK